MSSLFGKYDCVFLSAVNRFLSLWKLFPICANYRPFRVAEILERFCQIKRKSRPFLVVTRVLCVTVWDS